MEQLNRIELRGNVGSVKVQTYNDRKVAKLTIATNYAYRGNEGEPIIETTWHNVSAWEGRDVTGLEKLQKGSKVYVCGRMRVQKFNDNEGQEKTYYEVLASKLQTIDENTQMAYEM